MAAATNPLYGLGLVEKMGSMVGRERVRGCAVAAGRYAIAARSVKRKHGCCIDDAG